MKMYHYFASIIIIVSMLLIIPIGILMINLQTNSAFILFDSILLLVLFFVIIYEFIIVIKLSQAKKNGVIVYGKFQSVKSKYIFLETIIFEVDSKKVEVSPLLFIRGYEYLYRKKCDNVNLVLFKGKYYVSYK